MKNCNTSSYSRVQNHFVFKYRLVFTLYLCDVALFTSKKLVKSKTKVFTLYLCDVALFTTKKTSKNQKKSFHLNLCDDKKVLVAGKKCGPS